MNAKNHAAIDADGQPLSAFLIAGQASDYTGLAALLDDFPEALWRLGDGGYDADWFGDALEEKGIQARFASRRLRNEPVKDDTSRYTR